MDDVVGNLPSPRARQIVEEEASSKDSSVIDVEAMVQEAQMGGACSEDEEGDFDFVCAGTTEAGAAFAARSVVPSLVS